MWIDEKSWIIDVAFFRFAALKLFETRYFDIADAVRSTPLRCLKDEYRMAETIVNFWKNSLDRFLRKFICKKTVQCWSRERIFLKKKRL